MIMLINQLYQPTKHKKQASTDKFKLRTDLHGGTCHLSEQIQNIFLGSVERTASKN